MRRLLFLLLLTPLALGAGCENCDDVWDCLKLIIVCTWDSAACHPTVDDPPPQEPEWDPGIWPETRCEGTYMRVWTQGDLDTTRIFWIALEREEQVLSYSPGLELEPGAFEGYYMSIPLDGLQLDDGYYNLSLYFVDSFEHVGDPTLSTLRYQNARRITIPESTRSLVASKCRTPLRKSPEESHCLFPGDSADFTVQHWGNGLYLKVIPGYNTVNHIAWDVRGDVPGAGTVSDNGRFHALSMAPAYGDCWVIATDTSDPANPITDSICVVMDVDTIGGCNQTRAHASFLNQPGYPMIGAKATISSEYGRLCNALDTAHQAHSIASISVVHDTSLFQGYTNVWAQVGYMRVRFPGVYGYFDARYAELVGNARDFKVDIYKPSPSGQHEYGIELDTTTGCWYATIDGMVFDTLSESNPVWLSARGEQLHCGGEIRNFEDDMPGRASNPCVFDSVCAKAEDSYFYSDVDFYGIGNPYHTDSTQWIISVLDRTTLHLWDRVPRP